MCIRDRGSALQCLSNIEYLTQFMLNLEWVNDINTLNSLGCQGRMVCEYYHLLRKLWIKKEKYVSPKMIKKQIQKSFDQFAGYEQQDSQEFLGHFLDMLHEDLNKVLRKPYISSKDYEGQSLEQFGKENWQIHRKRENSMISKMYSCCVNKREFILWTNDFEITVHEVQTHESCD